MGFQNIIKLLKSDKQNLNYKLLKLKPLRYSTNYFLIFSPINYICIVVGLRFMYKCVYVTSVVIANLKILI